MDDQEPFLSPQPSQDLSHPSPLIYCSTRNMEHIPAAGRDAATHPSPGPVSCGRIPSANYLNHPRPLRCRKNNRSDSHAWKDVTASTLGEGARAPREGVLQREKVLFSNAACKIYRCYLQRSFIGDC